MTDHWRDLSDDEMRARLRAKGLSAEVADQLVTQRDRDDCALVLEDYLGDKA